MIGRESNDTCTIAGGYRRRSRKRYQDRNHDCQGRWSASVAAASRGTVSEERSLGRAFLRGCRGRECQRNHGLKRRSRRKKGCGRRRHSSRRVSAVAHWSDATCTIAREKPQCESYRQREQTAPARSSAPVPAPERLAEDLPAPSERVLKRSRLASAAQVAQTPARSTSSSTEYSGAGRPHDIS